MPPTGLGGTAYNASGGGVWTVGSGDVIIHSYSLIGRALWITISLDTTTITGTVTALNVPLPTGYTAAVKQSNPVIIYNASSTAMEVGEALVLASGTSVELRRPGLANFSASADATYIRGTWLIQVN
jgi:hypothetical protein